MITNTPTPHQVVTPSFFSLEVLSGLHFQFIGM
jgi:hypothetical protein